MIGKNREANQVDPETGGELLQKIFDRDLEVVQVFTGDWIISEQKAPAANASVNTSDGHLTGIEYFTACHSSHHPPRISRNF